MVRESDSDPGAEQFSQVYLSNGLNGFGMNAAGQVSFLATRSLGKIGIWVSENSALHNIVLQDQSAGPNSTFKFFGQPVMNSSGEIAFYGRVQEGQTTRETLWTWRDGQLQKIASSADNPIFAGICGSSRDRYAINDSGQIAFYTYSTTPPQTALWGYDPASGLHPIAAIGQSLEVAPGDVRTISDLLFQTGAGTGD